MIAGIGLRRCCLISQSFPVAAQAWWDRTELAQTWAGVEAGEEDAGWSRHVEQATQTLDVYPQRKRTSWPAARRSF